MYFWFITSWQLNQGCMNMPGVGHALWAEVGAGISHATFGVHRVLC